MKKKMITAALAAALCIALAGCSGKSAPEETLSESEQQAIAESIVSDIDSMVEDITGSVEGDTETPDADYETEAPDDESAAAETGAPDDESAAAGTEAPDADYETETETAEDTEASAAEDDINNPPVGTDLAVPLPLMYTGNDPYMPGVLKWMEEEPASYYDTGEYYIPAPVVFYTDDSDENDIRIWGNFWVFRYDLEGENLLCQSGGENPGILHLKKSDETGPEYEVFEFEGCREGSEFDEDLKKISEKAPAEAGDVYKMFTSAADDGTNEAVRKEYIKMYADQVPFTITSYQDYGWDPVMINE